MFSYKRFAKYIDEKYDVSFLTSAAKKDAKKLAELLYYETAEFFENFTAKNIFESAHYRRFFIREIIRVIRQYKYSADLRKKILYRAYYNVKEVYAQKHAMLSNKSRSADLDLILSVLDTSHESEISQMYVTISSLKNILDEKTYEKIRKDIRDQYGSCRANAQYFLYVLSQVVKFEEEFEIKDELANEVKKQEVENKELTKTCKEEKNKKIYKNIEIQASEQDYVRRVKGKKLDKVTRYKLYLYRRKYEDELCNVKLKRLTKDDLLFFLVNAESLNNTLTLSQILEIIRYADSNPAIINPVGWLIERLQISRGRFYFLLRKTPENEKQTEKQQLEESPQINQRQSKEQDNSVYIRQDLLYFAEKYSIQLSKIYDYVKSLNLRGDVSFAVEQYLTSLLWKHHISTKEKRELIQHAIEKIKKFVVPPKPSELESYIKSIIRNKIREEYLILTIEDKIRLFSQKQHSNLQQHYDTS